MYVGEAGGIGRKEGILEQGEIGGKLDEREYRKDQSEGKDRGKNVAGVEGRVAGKRGKSGLEGWRREATRVDRRGGGQEKQEWTEGERKCRRAGVEEREEGRGG